MNTISLDRIQIDPALQARVMLDEPTVVEYLRSAMEAADDGNPWPFPPIQIVGGRLVDGWHRLELALCRMLVLCSEMSIPELDEMRTMVATRRRELDEGKNEYAKK